MEKHDSKDCGTRNWRINRLSGFNQNEWKKTKRMNDFTVV
jgi:hypothetical protein